MLFLSTCYGKSVIENWRKHEEKNEKSGETKENNEIYTLGLRMI
jgi:hypothetical protein